MIGIYKITNILNNKVYIGQSSSITRRFKVHKKLGLGLLDSSHYKIDLYNDMKKYGIENFKFEILEKVSLDELEEKWINSYINNGVELYNKELTPTCHSSCKKFNDEEINKIILLLKENKLSNIEISKIMNCSSSLIDNINNGKRYKRDDENYPLSKSNSKKGAKCGSLNHNSIFTDEEVFNLRKRFVDETMSSLYNDYKNKISKKSFERIINGRTYSYLPIYKKRENKWYLNNKLYRLEP